MLVKYVLESELTCKVSLSPVENNLIHFVLIDDLKLKTHCTFLLSEVDTSYYFLSFKSQEHFQLMINMNTAHLVICFYALL